MYGVEGQQATETGSMPRVTLTDRFVSGVKTGDYFDTKSPGLNLRVTPNWRADLVLDLHVA